MERIDSSETKGSSGQPQVQFSVSVDHKVSNPLFRNLLKHFNPHERDGVATGAIIDGFIVKFHPWRYIYYVAIAIIGGVTLIVYATFPETAFTRNLASSDTITTLTASGERVRHSTKGEEAGDSEIQEVAPNESVHNRGWLMQGLKLYHGKYTHESIWQMASTTDDDENSFSSLEFGVEHYLA
ncbi:hypothetical protein PENARI_c115G09179 [Penicillium arizonense]|uniref:Uncharacterized protein n=1 Tax=Penicillium arizonense TaxID=1835702 RepID=A0A1F5L1A2_PENAI|nr:hypothetical protein PENARI_c115G09179 [Penicillium arizonense]OGE46770.1 hypothetical protein PENARI_c115G09179 [Penicillium arizonense]